MCLRPNFIPNPGNKCTKSGRVMWQIWAIVSKLIFLNMNEKGLPKDDTLYDVNLCIYFQDLVLVFFRVNKSLGALQKIGGKSRISLITHFHLHLACICGLSACDQYITCVVFLEMFFRINVHSVDSFAKSYSKVLLIAEEKIIVKADCTPPRR